MRARMSWVSLLCFVFLSGAFAQTASLSGIVYQSFCVGICPAPEKDSDPCGLTRAPGVGVWLGDAFYTETAQNGAYGFSGVPAESYKLGVFVDGYGVVRQPVTLRPGQNTVDLVIPFDMTPGEINVTFVPNATREQIDALNEAYGCTIVRIRGPYYTLKIPEGAFMDDFVDAYQQEPLVQSAQSRDPLYVWCV